MSQIVETNDGLKFNCVTNGKSKWFILECPVCAEKLQLTPDMLDGNVPITHESRIYPAAYCTFEWPWPLGASLVAAMQKNILFDGTPFSRIE